MQRRTFGRFTDLRLGRQLILLEITEVENNAIPPNLIDEEIGVTKPELISRQLEFRN